MDQGDFSAVVIGDHIRFLENGEEKSTYEDLAPPLLYSRFQQTSIPRMMLTLISIFLFFPIAYLLVSSMMEIFEQRASSPTPALTCGTLGIRREWRQLSTRERQSYLNAVTCLTTKPSTLNLSTSLYDDFTYAHIQIVYRVHHVAISLPWHRYFIHLYEQALKNECRFEGTLPYWDWTLDSSRPLDSPIWDPVFGFGGDRLSAQSCVEGGPLGNILLNYTGDGLSPHCLTRDFDRNSQYGILHGSRFSEEVIDDILTTASTFGEFRDRFENGPHKHIHDGIGGEMPGSSSPNDPLFFLHHAQSDRLWWMWQNRDLGKRKYEFTGTDNFGTRVSLEDMIDVAGLTEKHPVLHMMSTENGPFCYRYSDL